MVLDLFIHWLVLSLNYVLLAAGLTFTFSVMRIINFAHGHFYMAGAFFFYYFLQSIHIPYLLALLLSMVVIGILGMIVENRLYRPLGGRVTAQIVCMVGVLMIMEGVALVIYGPGFRDIPAIVPGVLQAGTTTVSYEKLVVVGTAIAVIGLLFYFVRYTRRGKAIRAVAQDSYAASLAGISVVGASAMTMGIGTAMAALAGVQISAVYMVDPFVGIWAVITSFLIITLGGMGSIPGAVVGAFIIGGFESWGSWAVGRFSFLLSFGVVILILVVRPRGLFGVPFEIVRHEE